MNQLDALKEMTTVVADTGDIESIKKYSPVDATTNPSLVLKAAQLSQYQNLIKSAIKKSQQLENSTASRLENACDQIAVDIGTEILKYVPGRISTEVDARFAWDAKICVSKARKIIQLYQNNKIEPSRILIKLAATWEGIKAAEILEKEGINCNLTLIFSFAQARACAEAGVFLISPFVGRIYDWYQKNEPVVPYSPQTDPGVASVSEIYQYYKTHDYKTVVMGASFRRKEQVLALAGCDRLTISPAILDDLIADKTPITQKLTPSASTQSIPMMMTQAEFLWLHNQNPMAVEKLAEGIRLFAADQIKLESLVQKLL